MKKTITTFLMGAAVLAPLALSTPAVAQSQRDIQRLEERVQEAKNRGDWGYAQQLERQLNVERLAYQRRHGIPEYNDNGVIRFNLGDYTNNGYYNNGYYYPNSGYYYPNYNNSQYQRGYYDRRGRWHRY